MSLRTFVMSQLARVMPEPRSTAYEGLLKVDAADEQAYLLQQVNTQYAFLKAFDAEMRLSISRLHEPEENKLIPAQIEQLITMKGRITTVLAMSSVQTLGQAKHKTPLPVVQAKLALDLGGGERRDGANPESPERSQGRALRDAPGQNNHQAG